MQRDQAAEPARHPLAVRGITVSYPTGAGRINVIEDVSFDLLAGETLGLVGESGSGKSMTALSILRLHEYSGGRIDEGSIRFFGSELVGLSGDEMSDIRGAEISMIFQDAVASLDPAFTVGQQMVNVLVRHSKMSRRAAKIRAVELLREVGIPEPGRRIDQYPHQFSGGMCQRVMIAMALSCSPQVLLADEPTTALDVTTQAQIVGLLHRLSEEYGMSIIFTTHDLSLVSEICDRVAVMYAGQIVEIGDVDSIFTAPTHPYTQALLDCAVEPSTRGDFAPIAGQSPSPHSRPAGCRFHPRCEFAQEECRDGQIEITEVAPERFSRCVRHADLRLPGVTS